MAGSVYYEQIEDTFEKVETAIEALPDDVDIRGAEGVINVTLAMVSSSYSVANPRQSNSGWQRRVADSTISGVMPKKIGLIPKPVRALAIFWSRSC